MAAFLKISKDILDLLNREKSCPVLRSQPARSFCVMEISMAGIFCSLSHDSFLYRLNTLIFAPGAI